MRTRFEIVDPGWIFWRTMDHQPGGYLARTYRLDGNRLTQIEVALPKNWIVV